MKRRRTLPGGGEPDRPPNRPNRDETALRGAGREMETEPNPPAADR